MVPLLVRQCGAKDVSEEEGGREGGREGGVGGLKKRV